MRSLSTMGRVGLLGAGAMCLGHVSASSGQVSFQGVPAPPNVVVVRVHGASSDLSVFAGTTRGPAGERPGRWTSAGGFVAVPMLPSGLHGWANGTSGDGSVIVGYTDFPATNQTSAWRWTADGGTVALPNSDGYLLSQATSISRDGAVIGGSRRPGISSAEQRATLWTPEGIFDITVPDSASAGISAVNGDGSAAAGTYFHPQSGPRAFRWTQSGGVHDIDSPPGWGVATGSKMSDDGSVVAGNVKNLGGPGSRVLRWTHTGETQLIGAGTDVTSLRALSADGSAIGGSHQPAGLLPRPFYWSESLGFVDVTDLLIAHGVDLTQWSLNEVSAIGDDNVTIAGTGEYTDAMGNTYRRIWTATIPAPGTGVLLLGLALLPGRRRRR